MIKVFDNMSLTMSFEVRGTLRSSLDTSDKDVQEKGENLSVIQDMKLVMLNFWTYLSEPDGDRYP